MKKAIFLALAGALMMATSAFTTTADAGYGHRHYHFKHYYKPYYVHSYSYTPYYYAPACKFVYRYGYVKKVCW